MSHVFIVLLSLTEIILFLFLWRFFNRLRRSEKLLTTLQSGQGSLLRKLELNANLERELMESFARRQAELRNLDLRLEERADALRKLLEQTESVSRSPQFLREVILAGSRKGRTPAQLAKSTGLSADEVELILAQAGN